MAVNDPHPLGAREPGGRERVVRTLTFWLRPEFALRALNRFQKVAGFDRSVALASSALTAMIPLLIVVSATATKLGGKGTADRLIERYDLTGGGAEAVKDIFSPPTGTSTSLGVVGFLFLLVAVLSFSRAVQRLFEQTWELTPLSVRNTLNGLLWTGGLALYLAVGGFLHATVGHGQLELAAALLDAPLSVVFLALERLGAHGQASRAAGTDPVRDRGSGAARALLGGRDRVCAAPLRHVCHPVRRDRRGLRDHLRAVRRHGHDGRLGDVRS